MRKHSKTAVQEESFKIKFTSDGSILEYIPRPASLMSKESSDTKSKMFKYISVPEFTSVNTGIKMPPSKKLNTTIEITEKHFTFMKDLSLLEIIPEIPN